MIEQKLKNHGRYVPFYHFFTLPVLIVNFGARVYFWVKGGFALSHFFSILLAAALFLGVLYARVLRWRADELTVNQFVSLRFASDDELRVLMKKVLDEKLKSRKAIKQLIKNWRPDYLRA